MEQAVLKLRDADVSENSDFFLLLNSFDNIFEKTGQAILVFSNNELLYWSDRTAAFEQELVEVDNGLIHLPNGWYVVKSKHVNNYTLLGLTLIKYDYKIQNNFLKNNFATGFHLPQDYEIHFYPSEQTFPVHNKQNIFLFSINPTGELPCIYSDLYIPAALYIFALLMLFMTIYRGANHYFHRYKPIKLLVIYLLLAGIYKLMHHFNLPPSVYHTELFSPKYFAYSALWSSMGELLIFSIFIFFGSLVFIRLFDISKTIKKNKAYSVLSFIGGMVMLAFLFVFIRKVMFILIMNSGVSFAVYRLGDISLHSFPGFLAISFLYFSFFFVAYRFVLLFRKIISAKTFFVTHTVVTTVVALTLVLADTSDGTRLNLFFWLIISTLFFVNYKSFLNHRLSIMVMFSVLFTLFTLTTLVKFIEKHETQIQSLMAYNLSAQHDPTAEIFLRDIDSQLKSDTLIPQLLIPPYREAADYIGQKYFGGYLRDYELQQTFCIPGDSLIIQPGNTLEPCSYFFHSLINEYGAPIPGTNFYFLDNINGRITYFGQFSYKTNTTENINLYIELNSRLISEGAGFPELLLPSQSSESRLRNNFSFAKYNNGELVDRSGTFLYALTTDTYSLPENSLHFFKSEGYLHCVYRISPNNYILVSREHIGAYDYLIAFPYIFVFLFILALIVNFLTNPYLKPIYIRDSLRMRIQASIIGVVFVALLLVGGGTILYIIKQYQSNHENDLIDKINSVSVELEFLMHDVEYIDEYTANFLNHELIAISDIFWIDINIYDLDGKLAATSRPEVFERGIVSSQMDNAAFYFLANNKPTRHLHQEHIAKMKYFSAYVPLVNMMGDIIGYINIPYFTKEREFRKQITTFIFAFINIYVFLLLASILVAYYISARITDPLRLILENLRKVQLGKSTKRIEYHSKNEIGLLVAEYNNKVEELAIRAEQLARSERETAWREMAKQIAHEIKNPLTPMKLNIQFLQKSDPSNSVQYKEKIKRITDTLIEQIDNLSAIATEFSNFAKIPRAKNQVFNLSERLNETLKLYNYTGQVEILTRFENTEKFKVYADPEQFSRAIINLIKNSIQAIPEHVKGKIEIGIKKQNGAAIIYIQDNGKGIPENLKDSIFVPNFTTKTSGAGLGLAITRNIVENFKGEIWFHSSPNIGSTFFIKIPYYTR